MKDKFILDACCGAREMWFNKNHPVTIYIDIRKEEKGFSKYHKRLEIKPDKIMDFRRLEFKDNTFKLVVLDPPHLKNLTETSMMKEKYGQLNKETWPADLKKGFEECWRVLEDYGILIFKWNDHDIKFEKVLNLFSVRPLFGTITKARKFSCTKWFCFMKIPPIMQSKNKSNEENVA